MMMLDALVVMVMAPPGRMASPDFHGKQLS
jgi:hypothetical protein